VDPCNGRAARRAVLSAPLFVRRSAIGMVTITEPVSATPSIGSTRSSGALRGGVVELTLRDGTLTVRDHGPGFSTADLPHIFERFYRANDARGMPGSGLGLAIVRQAAEAHGGGVEGPTPSEVAHRFAFASVREQNDGTALRRSADEPAGNAFEDGITMDATDWKRRDTQNRERFALRRAIAELAAGERQLARAFDAFGRRLDLVEHDLDVELRREHWGRDPERPPAWTSGRKVAEAAAPSVPIPDLASRHGRAGTRVGITDELATAGLT
jgi:hypothetical protein